MIFPLYLYAYVGESQIVCEIRTIYTYVSSMGCHRISYQCCAKNKEPLKINNKYYNDILYPGDIIPISRDDILHIISNGFIL